MFVTFGIAWLLVNLSMSWIVCDNVENAIHLGEKSQEAYDKYIWEMTPICNVWQDVVDSRFIYWPLPFQSALVYCAAIILLAAFLEIVWVWFEKEQFAIHDESNDWKTFLFVRGGWFFACVIISMTNTFH